MPVLPAFAPQGRRSRKNWGFPLQKKFLRMGSGDRNNRAGSGKRTHFGSIIFQIDAFSVHFDEAYQSFYMVEMRGTKLASVYVNVFFFWILDIGGVRKIR